MKAANSEQRRSPVDTADVGGSAASSLLDQAVEPGIYRHFKGAVYEVIGMALHSESLAPMVVYRSRDTRLWWVRPAEMWGDEVSPGVKRFERI